MTKRIGSLGGKKEDVRESHLDSFWNGALDSLKREYSLNVGNFSKKGRSKIPAREWSVVVQTKLG